MTRRDETLGRKQMMTHRSPDSSADRVRNSPYANHRVRRCAERGDLRPWRQSGVTDSLSGFASPCCLALLLLDVGQLLYSIGLRTFAFGLAALRLSVLQLGLCGCTGFLFCPDPA